MQKHGLSLAFVQKLCVLYLVVWMISPPMEIDLIYRLLALGCAAFWFIIMIIREGKLSLFADDVGALVFMLFVMVVAYLGSGSISDVIRQISYYILVMCYIMNRRYSGNWSELRGIIQIVLILCIIFNFITVKTLSEDSSVARLLIRDTEDTYKYLRQGVGGYSLIYPQVCIIPAGTAWTVNAFRHNKFDFLLGVVWLLSFAVFALNAGYSLAIFASAVGIFMLFFYKGRSGTVAFVISVAIFVGAMLSILYMDSFRNFLLSQFDGTAVAKKINDLVASSETGAAEGSINDRIRVYKNTLELFIKYPVIGSLWRNFGGGHSAFLDTFAVYGVFGCVVFTKMMYAVPNNYKNIYDMTYIMYVANASLVTLLFVTVLDSFTYSFVGMIMFIMPMFFEDIIKWRKLNNEGTLER